MKRPSILICCVCLTICLLSCNRKNKAGAQHVTHLQRQTVFVINAKSS